MIHPTQQDLISLLYDDVSSEKRAELNAHLKSCADCRTQIADWQKVKGELQTWPLPAAPKSTLHFSKAVQWAAAALLMIGIGFGFGRFALSQPDVTKMRAAIESELRQTFAQELKSARETDRKEVIAMLKDIEVQRLSDYSQLRKDLETVAVVADEKLTKTERVLSQANLFAQSESNNSQPQ